MLPSSENKHNAEPSGHGQRSQKLLVMAVILLVTLACVAWVNSEPQSTVTKDMFVEGASDHHHGGGGHGPPRGYRPFCAKVDRSVVKRYKRWVRACNRYMSNKKKRTYRGCLFRSKQLFAFPLHVKLTILPKLGVPSVNQMIPSARALVKDIRLRPQVYRLLIRQAFSEKKFKCRKNKFTGLYYTAARKRFRTKYHWHIEFVGKKVGRGRRRRFKMNHIHADVVLGAHKHCHVAEN